MDRNGSIVTTVFLLVTLSWPIFDAIRKSLNLIGKSLNLIANRFAFYSECDLLLLKPEEQAIFILWLVV